MGFRAGLQGVRHSVLWAAAQLAVSVPGFEHWRAASCLVLPACLLVQRAVPYAPQLSADSCLHFNAVTHPCLHPGYSHGSSSMFRRAAKHWHAARVQHPQLFATVNDEDREGKAWTAWTARSLAGTDRVWSAGSSGNSTRIALLGTSTYVHILIIATPTLGDTMHADVEGFIHDHAAPGAGVDRRYGAAAKLKFIARAGMRARRWGHAAAGAGGAALSWGGWARVGQNWCWQACVGAPMRVCCTGHLMCDTV